MLSLPQRKNSDGGVKAAPALMAQEEQRRQWRCGVKSRGECHLKTSPFAPSELYVMRESAMMLLCRARTGEGLIQSYRAIT